MVAARSSRSKRSDATPESLTTDPKVVVCAWCGRRGGDRARARFPGERPWQTVSRAFAKAVRRAGYASDGICPACRPLFEGGWSAPADGAPTEGASREAPSVGPLEADEPHAADGDTAGHVLVVDDDADVSALLAEVLTDAGYSVATVADAFGAIGVLRTAPPDLILLDLMLPALDGLTFLDLYRRLPGPHAPVVVLTAAPLPVRRAAERIALAVVSKPFDVDRLIALVDRHVDRASVVGTAAPSRARSA